MIEVLELLRTILRELQSIRLELERMYNRYDQDNRRNHN